MSQGFFPKAVKEKPLESTWMQVPVALNPGDGPGAGPGGLTLLLSGCPDGADLGH